MKERHNIVGSEVGRPRPPVYLSPTQKMRKPRSPPAWIWIPPLAAVLLLIGAVARLAG